MSITLSQMLGRIPDDQTVAQLNLMLPRAEVFISWWGQRMVRINDEAVTIDAFAKKYLHAAFQCNSLASEKAKCWKMIKSLYEKSDKELGKTWTYKFLTPMLECGLYDTTVQFMIRRPEVICFRQMVIEAAKRDGVQLNLIP
jgi:hypothetical protein